MQPNVDTEEPDYGAWNEDGEFDPLLRVSEVDWSRQGTVTAAAVDLVYAAKQGMRARQKKTN